jgi:hypothetical protein
MWKMIFLSMRSNNKPKAELVLIGLILLLPFFVLFPSLNSVPFPTLSPYSDLVISHLPNIIEVRDALTQTHQIPLWSETILGGYPFISDPLSGIWYPPIWLTWFLPIPFSINFLVILHLYFAEVGMFLYLKKNGYGLIPALTGAFIAGLAPKIWGHYAYGHITLIFAYAWTPWLLLFSLKDSNRKRLGLLAPGMVLAWIILADLRWFIYAFFIFLFYKIYQYIFTKENYSLTHGLFELSKDLFFNSLTAVVLCLPYLILVLQYSQLSTRNMMTVTDQLALSLPTEGLFGFFFPDMAGNAEWITYAGALTLLVILNLFFSKMDKDAIFWVITLVLAIFFAMGVRPLSDLLFRIPGLNLLRVPSRAILISIFAIGILTAKSCDLIIQQPKKIRIVKPFWFNLLAFGTGVFSVLIVIGMSFFVKGILIKFIWGAGFYLAFFVLLLFRDRQIVSGKIFGVILLPLIILDLLTVGFSQLRFADFETVMNEKISNVEKIKALHIDGRIYSPSYSIPQQTAAINHLELVNGIDPIQLRSFAEYMAAASGVPYAAYSVTIPPFGNGNPNLDNKNSIPNMELMGKLNVQYIISEFEMASLKENLVIYQSGSYIYENPQYLSRARLVDGGGSVQKAVEITDFHPGKIEMNATGPGKLVLSENYYPGWEVYVDGFKGADLVYDHIFQSVDLEKGYHQVTFIFTPELLIPSFLFVFLIAAVFWGWNIVHT